MRSKLIDAKAPIVTAEDVASEAGVSRWTVGRAFKNEAPISEKTRQKVLSAADKLGYTPDLHAAALASDRSNLVALIFDDFENPHKLVMLERLSSALQTHGWSALLINSSGAKGAAGALKSASQRRVDAAVLIGTEFDDEMLAAAQGAQRIKKLVVLARESNAEGAVAITCDDDCAMAAIVDLMEKRGRMRPLFLAGPRTRSASLRRADVLQRELARRGAAPAQVLYAGEYHPDRAYRCIVSNFDAHGGVEAINVVVCENDILAIGAVDALRYGLGLRVPEDVAVVGYDDIALAAAPSYALTTVRQPISKMVAALVDMLKTETESRATITLAGELVVRSSL
ncbi:MAG: substrate-binding domain-containing protein [Neomegalonema sp.]|nr:substrate-binding domain-containing protein [Neomegalonema sp.]